MNQDELLSTSANEGSPLAVLALFGIYALFFILPVWLVVMPLFKLLQRVLGVELYMQ